MGTQLYKMYSSLFLFSSFLALSSASEAGPYQGLRAKDTPHFQDPSCVEFTLQDNLPPETVQLITYGAPEMSTILAMGLMGDGVTFAKPGQKVTTHYALFLDNCKFIESSREFGVPFSFTFGAGEVITGFERGIGKMSLGQRVSMTLSPDMGYGDEGAGDGTIPGGATLIFDLEIIAIEDAD